MASYTSDLSFPNFVEYYLTLYTGDYDVPGTYGEPILFSQEEFGSFFPSPVSVPNGGEVYHTSRLGSEDALTEQAFDGERPPYNSSGNWLAAYEAYFDGFWEEDRFGSGVDAFNSTNGSGTEKAEAQAADPWEEQRGGYNSYGNGVEMQPGNEYNTWSGNEYGNEEDVHDSGTNGVDAAYNSSYSWDEMELCESIFGGLEI